MIGRSIHPAHEALLIASPQKLHYGAIMPNGWGLLNCKNFPRKQNKSHLREVLKALAYHFAGTLAKVYTFFSGIH